MSDTFILYQRKPVRISPWVKQGTFTTYAEAEQAARKLIKGDVETEPANIGDVKHRFFGTKNCNYWSAMIMEEIK